MNLSNLNISTRLRGGFGFLILLSLISVIFGVARFTALGSITDEIVNDHLVNSAASHQFDGAVREDAMITLGLFIESDPAVRAKSLERIAGNTKVIDTAMVRLQQQATTPEEKDMAVKMRRDRAAYEAGFASVVAAINAGDRDTAIKTMHNVTMPALESLLKVVKDNIAYQQNEMTEAGQEADNLAKSARILTLAIGLTVLIAGIVLALLLTRSITGPLNDAVGVAKKVAGGDLTTHIEIRSTDEAGQLMQALRDMNDSLSRTVSEVLVATDTMSTAAGEIASGNLDLSQRTESQASSLEEIASSMERLTSTVSQNADNARQANQLVVSASGVASKGGEVVGRVVSTMGSIKESSSKIVDIIGVIDSIAFQTNILALNAAVEAARAGEQGRGFAVVATEVRNLAQRSAAAAREIKMLIGDSVDKVDAGSILVDQAGQTMEEIVTSVKQVTDIMGEISAASSEQSAGIRHVSEAISLMDVTTQQNAALVEEAAAAAQSLQDQATSLSALVSIFTTAQVSTRRPTTKAPTSTARPALVKSTSRATPPVRTAEVTPKLASPAAGGDWESF